MNDQNEWRLFLLVEQQLDAGLGQVSFTVLEPASWTMFSALSARLRGPNGLVYEVGPAFAEVLRELARISVSRHLTNAPGDYRLYFRPGSRHPRHTPAAPAIPAAPVAARVP